jgi:hypothetical protein
MHSTLYAPSSSLVSRDLLCLLALWPSRSGPCWMRQRQVKPYHHSERLLESSRTCWAVSERECVSECWPSLSDRRASRVGLDRGPWPERYKNRVRWSGTGQAVVVQRTFSAASRGLLPFQDSQVDGCEMTSGCMRRATRVCQGEHAYAHAVQGKQGQQSAVYQTNVYAVGVTLAKVIVSMPDRRECASGPRDRGSWVTMLAQQAVLCCE